MDGIYRLKGTVKHYDWGGFSFIPSLLHHANPDKKPFAEYWMGIHSLGESTIDIADESKPLSRFAPRLPYLLKVLDVGEMLSIQVHPAKAAAEKGFADENAAGIPLDSPQRNYKDDNHKPELIVALNDFWLLHGFKPQEELVYTLLNVVELRDLLAVFNESGYAGLYKHVMEMPQEQVNSMLKPLTDNIAEIYKDATPEKDDEDFWAARAAELYCTNGNIDRGIFSIYLFNIVHLKKGEAIFQDAGLPHAYLEGQCVEIMSNSDNVLRGGLTKKHIDVAELLIHIICEPTYPRILEGEKNEEGENVYRTTAPNFQLSSFELQAGQTVSFEPVTDEILLLTGGDVEADDDNATVRLQPGTPSAIAFNGRVIYLAAAADSTVFRASTPL